MGEKNYLLHAKYTGVAWVIRWNVRQAADMQASLFGRITFLPSWWKHWKHMVSLCTHILSAACKESVCVCVCVKESVCVCVCARARSVVSNSSDPMDCSQPGSSVHGIILARILDWVAISFSRGSSRPRDWTYILCGSCTGR